MHNTQNTCRARSYMLTDEDQKTLMVASEGEMIHLKHQSALYQDPVLNYGSLIVQRTDVDVDFANSTRELIDEPNNPVESLAPLKRNKDLEREKKRKMKERKEAVNQLARPTESAERQNIFARIIPERLTTASRKIQKRTPTLRERTMDVATTVEDDKTGQRPLTRRLGPQKGMRNLLVGSETALLKKPSQETVPKRQSITKRSTGLPPTFFGLPIL
ncbi:unnamed protein product [Caenorhabditis sp. 36 PRJEB53466]|nr:unnamed protein product [Caenorhabditis sp. 36 PRJEB53466]